MLKAELPGFSKEDVQIELHDNRLTMRGERKQETEAKEEQYHRLERAYSRFECSFWADSSGRGQDPGHVQEWRTGTASAQE